MFCPHCGSHVADNSTYCDTCGKAINLAPQPTQTQQPQTAYPEDNFIAFLGFWIAIFFPFVGLVLCIIGYIRSRKVKIGGAMAMAGIIISVMELITFITCLCIYIPYWQSMGWI